MLDNRRISSKKLSIGAQALQSARLNVQKGSFIFLSQPAYGICLRSAIFMWILFIFSISGVFSHAA